MAYKILIKDADTIVTCDEKETLYHDSDILIENERIIKLGFKADEMTVQEADEVINAKGKIVYPGLINTHHHFFQTFVRSIEQIDYTGHDCY